MSDKELSKYMYIMAIRNLIADCHQTAKDKGWWDEERNDGEMLMLMVSELSEALEWLRKPIDQIKSDHIPDYLGIEEELADVLVRIFDYCGGRGLDLAGALVEKMEYNEGREYKHGKNF